jgi:AraC-like DNA-binding protein
MSHDPSENIGLADLAVKVKLSESRLAHLFRSEVGIPMRQYRLTLRMEEAVKEICRGSSLTHAAHAAGFADSAHFCRICRRMFGVTPSNLPKFKDE